MAAAFAFHGRKGIEYGFLSFILFSLLTTYKLVENLLLANRIIIMTLITVLFGIIGYRVASVRIFNYMKEDNVVRKPIDRYNDEPII
jgi:hypothetical protein